jgi:hypothetical protein
MNCPKCGVEMLELQGWDFLHYVCLSPVHPKPVHVNQTWCHNPSITERELSEREQEIIDTRKNNLIKGLAVVETNWELMGEIWGFLSGGFNPDIRKRIESTVGGK